MSSTLGTSGAGGGASPDDVAALQDSVAQLVAQVGALSTFQLLNPGTSPVARGSQIDGIGDDTCSVLPAEVGYSPDAMAAWLAGGGGASPLQITTTSLPAGTRNSVYVGATLQATGGTSPYSWDLDPTSAAMPAGMTLSAGGVIAGTPTVSGSFAMVFRCADSGGSTRVTMAITWTIAAVASALAFVPPDPLPVVTVGLNYSVDPRQWATGGSGVYTADDGAGPTLPNHGIDIVANVLVNTRAIVSTDITSSPPVMAVKIRITDNAGVGGAGHELTVTTHVAIVGASTPAVDLAPWVSTDYNKATGVGTYAQSGKPVVPANVVNAINLAAKNMAAVGGRIYSSVAGVLAVGAAAGASAWGVLIDSTCPNWDLDGTTAGTAAVTIVLAPKQPVNAPTQQLGAMIFQVHDVVAPTLRLIVDGNAHNQYGDGDTAFNVPAGMNPDGCYYHGVRKANCGATAGTVSVKNIRGVVGGNTSSDTAHGVAATEVFAFHDFRGYGADTLVLSLDTDDGTPANRTASGAVVQFRVNGSPGVTWIFTKLKNQRHGFGTFFATSSSAHVIGIAGTVSGNQRTFNLEAGYSVSTWSQANSGPTGDITIVAVFPATTFNVSGSTDTTIGINGNNTTATQGGNVNIIGMIDTSCADHIQFSGKAWASVTETSTQCVSPTNAATHFRSSGATQTAEAASYFLSGCTLHNDQPGAVAVQPAGGLHAGNGTWALV